MIHWPVREVFHAYTAIARRDAIEEFRAEALRWAVLTGPVNPAPKVPVVPKVLEG